MGMEPTLWRSFGRAGKKNPPLPGLLVRARRHPPEHAQRDNGRRQQDDDADGNGGLESERKSIAGRFEKGDPLGGGDLFGGGHRAADLAAINRRADAAEDAAGFRTVDGVYRACVLGAVFSLMGAFLQPGIEIGERHIDPHAPIPELSSKAVVPGNKGSSALWLRRLSPALTCIKNRWFATRRMMGAFSTG